MRVTCHAFLGGPSRYKTRRLARVLNFCVPSQFISAFLYIRQTYTLVLHGHIPIHLSTFVSPPSPLSPLRSPLSRLRPLICPASPTALYASSSPITPCLRIDQLQISCLVAAVPSSGCGVTDVKCQCTTGQAALTESLMSCIPQKCSADDAASTFAAILLQS